MPQPPTVYFQQKQQTSKFSEKCKKIQNGVFALKIAKLGFTFGITDCFHFENIKWVCLLAYLLNPNFFYR